MDLAVGRARKDVADDGGKSTPGTVQMLLRFSRLPAAAVRTILKCLDTDEHFRNLASEGLAEDDIDRASWLFLTRPEGWRDELDLIMEAAIEETSEVSAAARMKTMERQLDATRSALEEAEAKLEASRSALSNAERRAVEADGARRDAEEQVVSLELERSTTIRNLKIAERLAGDRLEAIRELEARIGAVTSLHAGDQEPVADHDAADKDAVADQEPARDQEPPGEPLDRGDAIDRSELAAVFNEVTASFARIANAFERAGLIVSPPTPTDMGPGVIPEPTGESNRFGRPTRRTPVKLTKGVLDGSIEGVRQLLSHPRMMVLVDGYNVAMEAWPTLKAIEQRSSLSDLAANVSVRTGAEIHLVFDGIEDGSRPNVSTARAVRIHFSPAEIEADDLILEMVSRTPGERPVVVVSSDRRVQDGSRRLGANVISSTDLLDFARNRAA